MVDFEKLTETVGNLEGEEAAVLLQQVMSEGGKDAVKAMEACQKGMDIVGSNFEKGIYFVGDLIYAGEIMTEAVTILKSALAAGDGGGVKAKMILCTVKNDLHDIGKNIVRAMMEAGGFDVTDLGIDVPPERIVEETKKRGVRIVALSGVLTLAINSMKATVDALAAEGLHDSVKVIIGGNMVNEEVCRIVGADAWATNPQAGVQTCAKWALSQKEAAS
jgi:methylmalonyl-CoA mutase cobalamin-binding domain/chain